MADKSKALGAPPTSGGSTIWPPLPTTPYKRSSILANALSSNTNTNQPPQLVPKITLQKVIPAKSTDTSSSDQPSEPQGKHPHSRYLLRVVIPKETSNSSTTTRKRTVDTSSLTEIADKLLRKTGSTSSEDNRSDTSNWADELLGSSSSSNTSIPVEKIKVEPVDPVDQSQQEEYVENMSIEPEAGPSQVSEQGNTERITIRNPWLVFKPNEPVRVAKARKILQEDKFQVWLAPSQDSQFPNHWGAITKLKHQAVQRKESISKEEFLIMQEYSGHFTGALCEMITRKELSRAVVFQDKVVDVMEQTMADPRQIPEINGPRSTALITLDPTWTRSAEAILVGFDELVHQPLSIKGIIINLSEYKLPEYPVKPNFEELEQQEIRESQLFKALIEKRNVVGSMTKIPILIEFYQLKTNHNYTLETIVGSFCKVIQLFQTHHSGPVIIVTVMPAYKPGESLSTYGARKLKALSQIKTINCLSQALGTAHFHIFTTAVSHNREDYLSHDSKLLPLYTAYGQATEELNRRFRNRLQYLLEFLKKEFTSGEERERLIRN